MPCRKEITSQVMSDLRYSLHATSHKTISIEANRIRAHELDLPRQFIHHVWVNAYTISCNFVRKEVTSAKAWWLPLTCFTCFGKNVTCNCICY